MEIVYAGSGWFEVVPFIRERLPEHRVHIADVATPIAEQLAAAHVLLPSNRPIDQGVLARAPHLRLIQQPAVGVDAIDLAAARARGIPVANAPGTNADSVAQAALLLMLALARRWRGAAQAFAAGVIGEPLGLELTGRTLGLVGHGQSARRLAAAAEALGMRVRALDSRATDEDRRALWADSDVISLHCPLTPRTRGLVDEAAFAAMKPGALLINVARGPIIDRSALEAALRQGQLGGVGLDVFWQEPWDPADPLWAHPRVLTLPHVGGTTAEAFGRIADIVATNVRHLERGTPLVHRLA